MNPVQLAGLVATPESPLQPAMKAVDGEGFLPVLAFVLDAPEGESEVTDDAEHAVAEDVLHGAVGAALPLPASTDEVVEEVEGWLRLQAGQRELRVDARDAGRDTAELPQDESSVEDVRLADVQAAPPAVLAHDEAVEPELRKPEPVIEAFAARRAEKAMHAADITVAPRADKPAQAADIPLLRPAALVAMPGLVPQAGDGGESRVSAAPSDIGMAGVAQWAAAAGTQGGVDATRSIEARFGEQMLHSLREQVELQVRQNTQHATLRLDPPDLGALDIHITHDQGKLSVQIHATQGDVARLLTLLSERLRHELLGQHFAEVTVEVGGEDRSGSQGRRPSGQGAEPEVLAAVELPDEASSRRDTGSDVIARA